MKIDSFLQGELDFYKRMLNFVSKTKTKQYEKAVITILHDAWHHYFMGQQYIYF